MKRNKIAFIYCVNDSSLYNESIKYVNSLNVPVGFEIDLFAVEEASSMAAGYNYAMNQSDAKYKVYLHQDVFIINKDFLIDVINLFEGNPQLGMVGVAGAKTIPTNGVWWEAKEQYGKVYDSHTGKMDLLQFNEVTTSYEMVQGIDGLIMITQYDIPWREDLFNGWHFYDLSHSIEFINAGYDVGVPMQEVPWVIHDCGIVNVKNGFDESKRIFIEEYLKDSLPLVSILIPTYNRPDYFELALQSALNQSYPNVEIIVCDDSTNDETSIRIQKYLNRYSHITYIKNEKNLGQFENDLKLLELSNGHYINFLMDDDLFHPEKIEKMMNYFLADSSITLVTSHRQLIDDKGNFLSDIGSTKKIFERDTVLDGKNLGDFVLKNVSNIIGEPTTVLFKKSALKEPFGMFNGRRYICNVDLASWLILLAEGKCVYINQSLSYFRYHSGQQLQTTTMYVSGLLDFAHQILHSRGKGFLEDNTEYLTALNNYMSYYESLYAQNLIDEFQIENENKIQELEQFVQYIRNEIFSFSQTDNNSQFLFDNPKIKKNQDGEHFDNINLPLVSILIPAYNQTKYLKEALESAINQTYPNIEIIIGDDSTTDEVEVFVKPYLEKYRKITYFKNTRDRFDYGYQNHVNCLKRSKGEYINFLNHDDLLHPEKIERMIKYFINNPNITLVTSVRQQFDEYGNKLMLNGPFQRLFEKDTMISGYELSRMVAKSLVNIIGEPTTVLFKRKYIEENKFGFLNGVRYKNIADVVTWFTLLEYGDAVYLSDTLSYFRVHSNQNSNNEGLHIMGIIAWYKLIKHSYEKGIIQNINEYRTIINKWLLTYIPILSDFNNKYKSIDFELKNELTYCFQDAIGELINRNIENSQQCVICGNEVDRFLPYQYKKHKNDFVWKFQIIGSDTDNFTCPKCYCHDCTRHLVMYFNKLNIWESHIINKKILHIAPESHLQKMISALSPSQYICGDLFPTNDSITKIDITEINFDDNYFDFIMCNHVLEHVPNDLKAMGELYRVLKPGGFAVLQTPYSPLLKKSFEDSNIDSDAKRKEFFGQEDHVRVYGVDFFERLKSTGFQLEIVKNDTLFTEEECKKYGVNTKEDLLLVSK